MVYEHVRPLHRRKFMLVLTVVAGAAGGVVAQHDGDPQALEAVRFPLELLERPLRAAARSCSRRVRWLQPEGRSNASLLSPQFPFVFCRDSLRAIETLAPFAADPPAPYD